MVRYSSTYLLSDTGSNHATAYCEFNKSVTLGETTFVVWTDGVAMTKGRSYDHTTGEWSEAVSIGEGVDNHNTPALTVDAGGRLRIAYGPHGVWGRYPDGWPNGTFKYAVAKEPSTLAGLDLCGEAGYPAGYRGTYGGLLHVPPGVDCLVYRGGEHPMGAIFQRRTPRGGWTNAQPLVVQDVEPQYTHVGAQITADRDGVMYVAAHSYAQQRGTNLGVVALKSADLGETWTDLSGNPVVTPVRWHEEIAVPPAAPGANTYVKALSMDARGVFHILTCGQGSFFLSRWENGWQTIDLKRCYPEGRAACGGTMTIDTHDNIHLVLEMPLVGNPGWGNPTTEIFHFVSKDGGASFEVNQLSQTDPETPSWIPSISMVGPYHPVEKPFILFMEGKTSHQCKVYGLFVESVE